MALLFLDCRARSDGELRQLVTALPADEAMLSASSPSALRRHVRQMSLRDVMRVQEALIAALNDSFPGFARRERLVIPRLTELMAVTREELGQNTYLRFIEAYARHPIEERRAMAGLLNRVIVLGKNPPEDLAERAAAYEDLIRQTLPFADALFMADVYAPYCELLPRLNRHAELPAKLEEALGHALAAGDTGLACQFLGSLGSHYAQLGNEAAMRDAWDRALVLARASHSWHEARILSFYAAWHRNRGDSSRAMKLLVEAEERCRELGADAAEIRFLYARLLLFADLSCWDLVERGMHRADVLMRTGVPSWKPPEREVWEVRFATMRMRVAAARGDDSAAIAVARDLMLRTAALQPGPDRERLRLEVAKVLSTAGRNDEAATFLERIIADGEAYGILELRSECRLLEARLAMAGGRPDDAEQALARFREVTIEHPDMAEMWVGCEVLAARLALVHGDRAEAERRVRRALDRLEARRAALGSSPEAFLTLGRFESLKSLVHEMWADDPRAGYAFEMAWARLRLGRPGPARAGTARPLKESLAPDAALPRLPAGTVHCVYSWGGTTVLRWTRSSTGFVREVLPGSADQLRQRLEAAAAGLIRSEATTPPDDTGLANELTALASLLLPAELLAPDDGRRLIITRDGPLNCLPFEALGLPGAGYSPLALRHDVAYLGLLEPAVRPAAGANRTGTLILADPEYADGITRRWAVLNERLPAGVDEAHRVAAAAPDPTLLLGGEATRQTLLARWETAGEIYLAGHCVRDPILPYDQYLPLAGSADSALVTTGDFDGANLAGCRLVILSGCETGVRYEAGDTETPSLGDIVVRAGAGAVVQTAWSVRDADAALVVHEFTTAHRARPGDPVGALGEARRRLIRSGHSPRVWAAYSLLLGSLPAAMPASTSIETAWRP